MPNIDPRLGLALPLITDSFSTSEIRANWEALLRHPGILIIDTIDDMPDWWGAPNTGMHVYQVDLGLMWVWNGTSLVRAYARGRLGTNRRTTNLTATSGSFVTLAQQTITVVPGNLDIALTASWSQVTDGDARMALFRGSTKLMEWRAVEGSGGACSWVDLDPALGNSVYSFQVIAVTGNITVVAAADAPASLDVSEV